VSAPLTYYAIQVKTVSETKFIRLYQATHQDVPLHFYFPQRKLMIRRAGQLHEDIKSIFPGYVFLELREDVKLVDYYWDIKHTDGFYRFLKSNTNIEALAGRNLETVLHFILLKDAMAGLSKVTFDENQRIAVAEGPLKGLEGKIIKVDKRHGRAKIKLDLYDDSFTIDLAFEMLERH
jgi:transcriptional antiterminator NusG